MGSLISCNRHDDDRITQSFPIEYEFEPEYIVYNRQNLTPEQLEEMPTKGLAIYTESDFPEENLMGLEKLKNSNIDFNKYTLLLCYNRVFGVVTGHRYAWNKNLQENKFVFLMNFYVDYDEDTETPDEELSTYYRSAVLVKKIPIDSEVEFWHSIHVVNSDSSSQ